MADPSRGMRWRDIAFWSVCLLWLGIAVSGSRIEAVTGVPVGSGSWLGLAVFAGLHRGDLLRATASGVGRGGGTRAGRTCRATTGT